MLGNNILKIQNRVDPVKMLQPKIGMLEGLVDPHTGFPWTGLNIIIAWCFSRPGAIKNRDNLNFVDSNLLMLLHRNEPRSTHHRVLIDINYGSFEE